MRQVREHREDLLVRVPRLRLLFVIAISIVGACYWWVQVVRGDYYRELADNNRLRRISIKAPRGLIYDRAGRLLVENVASYNLYLDRERSADPDRALEFAEAILGVDRSELQSSVERAGSRVVDPVLLAEDLTLGQVARFAVSELEFPEFEVEAGHLRLYRHGPMTAHALGYLGEATVDDLEDAAGRYRAGDLVGRKGVERAYDDTLRGRDGERVVIVDSRGRSRDEHGSTPAVAGRSLTLALDLDLQQEAARYFEDRVGAAVALDPRTGDVLALVSAPSYNPNVFARRLGSEEWRALIEAPHDPLQNRAVQNAHSPGSLFKIVVAAAGLSERVVNTRDAVHCSGSTRIYNRRFRCWKRAGHGWVNLHKAIRESCDIYFYYLGQKLGIEKIAEFARRFGLGSPTGFDLAGERRGLVPDTAWSLERRGAPWYPGETISVAIGQGPLLTTPLQMAVLMSTVANRGAVVTPRLAPGDEPVAHRRAELDASSLEPIREALWAVINEQGTGTTARVEGLEIAGKTGTVQVVRQATWIDSEDLPFEQRDHAWFAGFGPLEDPRLVVSVFVEHGGKGSQAAAPLARRLFEIGLRDALPSDVDGGGV